MTITRSEGLVIKKSSINDVGVCDMIFLSFYDFLSLSFYDHH